jgi:hypothetical protein
MCCFVSSIFLGGPRLALFFWWVFDTSLFRGAFNAVFWPIVGILFAPWTTLIYLIVWSPNSGVSGWDWLWLAIGVLLDLSMYTGSAWGNRKRVPGYAK